MNKVYRVIWNSALGAWVAASELASRRGAESVSSGQTRRVWQAPYLLISLVGGIIMSITPLAHATQANSYEIPLCTSKDDCKMIVVGHDGGSNRANVDTSKKTDVVQLRTDGKGATSKADNSNNNTWMTGNYGVAIGQNAQSKGSAVTFGSNTTAASLSEAIGTSASAVAQASMAIGTASYASGLASIAQGHLSYAGGDHAIAMGTVSTADADGAMAYGYSASATGVRAIAMGTSSADSVKQDTSTNTQATAQDSIALGTQARATAANSIGVGTSAAGSGSNATAVGNSAKASGSSAAAYGDSSTASGANSTGVGKSAAAKSDNSTALGNAAQATNTSATALGDSAAASGANSLSAGKGAAASAGNTSALGNNAKASAESASALGNGSNASGTYANALGASSAASGTYSNALGFNSQAKGAYSFAEGKDSTASGYSSTAIGNASKASDQQAIAMGLAATASGRRSIAIGAPSEESPSSTSSNDSDRIASDTTYGTQATSPDATAIGSGAKATNQYATALGTKANASSKNTVAIGKNAAASGTSAIAIGYDAKGQGNYSVTIGEDSVSKGDYSTALGNKASSAGNESVANGYQSSASQSNATALGSNTKASGANSSAIGNNAGASGESSLAAGTSSNASGAKATALGAGSQATGENATAAGRNASSSGANAIASGYNANAADQSAIALGDSSSAAKENALAVGRGAQANETGSIALGQAAKSSETNAIAVGNSSAASGDSAVALGNGAKSSSASGVALGEGADASRAGLNGDKEVFSGTAVKSQKGAVSVGSANNERQIINVAGGTQDTDAVNLRQLRYVGSNLASSLGGGAAFDSSTGAYTAPTYTNNNRSYNNVASALKDVNIGAVKYNRDSNGNVNFGKITLEGAGPKEQQPDSTAPYEGSYTIIDKLGDGEVSATSYEAINGSQLYTEQTQRQKGDTGLASALGGGAKVADDGTVTAPTYTVHNADGSTKDVNNVGDALTNVDQRTDGNTTAINNINSGKAGLTQQQAAGEKITVGKDTDGTEVSFADKNGKTRTLSNVSAGKIASDSTDAVNGSQLYGTSNSVANALGGGSKVNDDGTVSNPSYTVHNADGSTTTANNVGDALTNVDQRTDGNTTAINNINSGKAGLVQQESAGKPITVAKDTDGTEVTFADKDGKTRKLTNVTDGDITDSSKDAVNGSQLHTEQAQRQKGDDGLANALGGGAKVADDGTVTAPTYTVHNADGSTKDVNNVGDALTNVDQRTDGNTTAINNINSGKTGLTQQQAAGEKITVGKDTDGTEVSFADKDGKTRTLSNVSAGKIASDSTDAVNGSQLYAGNQSIADALGGGSTLNPDGTVTKPAYTNNGNTYNNIGDALKDVNDGAVKYDRNSDGSINKDKASLEGGSNGTTLDNVAPGTVASDSKQAVNGSQLYTEQTQRQKGDDGLANALGGGAKVADDGTVTAPTYTVHNADGSTKDVNNVGDALTNVDQRTDGNTTAINNINSGKAGLTQQQAAGEKITVGKDTDGTEVSFADKDGKTRTLSNVSAGKIASDSTDAVNGSQLYAGNQSIADALGGGSTLNPDGTVTKPTYTNNGNTYNNIGDALKDVNDGAVKYDRNSDGSINKDKASLEGGSNGTTLDNVAPGTVASDSKQAVNGSQLYTEQTQRQKGDDGLANALGGGAKVADDGTVTAPTYTVHNADGSTKDVNNVGDALTNVDQRTDGNTTAINNINSGKTGLTQQQAAGEKITVGKDTDGTEVSFADKDGKTRTLSNVSAGKIASDSTDAVNGSQLYAGNQSIADALGGGSTLNPDGTVTKPTYTNNGNTYNNMGDALKDVNDGAVKYDRNSDGSINKDKASLEGGSNGTTLDNVAAGSTSKDSKQAVNGSQLYATNQRTADALGGGATVDPTTGAVTGPTYTVHNADGSTKDVNNVGDALSNVDNRTADNTTAINNINSGKTGLTQQQAAGEKITVGKDTDGTEVSFADKDGKTRTLSNVSAGKIGSDSTDAVNGSQLYAGNQSIADALGGGSTLNPDGTVTKPTYTNNGNTYNNMGDALKDVNDGAVKYDRNSDGSINKDKASLEGGSNGTTLDNVAPGTVASDSKQAVNGSQLYTEQTQRQKGDDGLANALGGGAKVADDGTVTAPTYTVHNADGSTKDVNNVGDALTNVDQRTDGNTTAINNINSGKAGLTQQQAVGEKITVGKDTDGTEVSFADKDGKTRTLSNVSAGKIASDSTDAVNGSQLYAGNQSIADALGGGSTLNPDGTVTKPTYTNNGNTYNNMGDALKDVNDGAVKYDRNSDGSINKDKASLEGGSNGTTLDNVAPGTVASDSKQAVNGSQLYTEQTQRQKGDDGLANALGGGAKVADDGTVTAPTYTVHNADGSTKDVNNVGDALTNVDQRTDGNTTAINNINSGKTGLTQQQAAGEKITVGKDTDGTEVSFADKDGKTRTLSNVSAGKIASDSTDAVNGSQLYAGNQSIANALGGGSTLNPDGTVTKPTYTNNGNTYNNIGDALKDVNDGAVKYDRNSDGSINKDKASLEGGSNGTTLDNVAAGSTSKDSKQAVNGSQLYATNQRTADALGGGATVDPTTGAVTGPTYTVHNADGSTKDVNNVGDALSNVDNRTADNTTAINNINSGKTGLTQQQAAGEKITVGKDTDGTEVSFADKDGKTRTLSNVSAGKIASDSTDAVNGSQLYAGNQSIADALGGGSTLNPDGTVTKPTYTNNGNTYNNMGDALKDVNDGAVKYDRNSDGFINKDKASLEGGSNGTTLDNVAAGSTSKDSKQAVNGSQLYATNQRTADALGGGAAVDSSTGDVTGPTYKLHHYDQHSGQEPIVTYTNVGDALGNLDGRTLTNTDQIREIAGRVNPAGQYGYSINGRNFDRVEDAMRDIDAGAVKYDRNSDGTINTDKASLQGKNGTVLDNVADGNVVADSKQAVNGSQLYATNQAISNINNGKTGLTQQQAPGEKITVGKDTDGTEVSFADKNGGTRKLTSVTDGEVSATSKDAVNGSQLYTEQTQRQKGDSGLADALGGGAKVAGDGTVTAPTYTVHNADGSTQNVNNVGDAVSNLDGRTADNTSAINNINSGKTGIVQQENTDAPITVGKSSGGTQVTFADKDGKARKLTNVSKGKVSSDSQDAINGSQLSATSVSVANALGGGAKINDDGTISSPTYTVNGDSYANAGDAIHALSGGTASKSDSGNASATGNNSSATGGGAKASGNKATAVGDNAAATHSNSVALGAGSKTDRDNSVSVGSEGNERAITNVADGTQPHDAATVGQMSRGFGDMSRRIDKVDRNAKAGTASAMAMTGLPQAVLPGRSMLSAGGGTYEGQSAVAVGLSTMTDNGRWIIKGQVSGNTQGDVGGAVGVGYQW